MHSRSRPWRSDSRFNWDTAKQQLHLPICCHCWSMQQPPWHHPESPAKTPLAVTEQQKWSTLISDLRVWQVPGRRSDWWNTQPKPMTTLPLDNKTDIRSHDWLAQVIDQLCNVAQKSNESRSIYCSEVQQQLGPIDALTLNTTAGYINMTCLYWQPQLPQSEQQGRKHSINMSTAPHSTTTMPAKRNKATYSSSTTAQKHITKI